MAALLAATLVSTAAYGQEQTKRWATSCISMGRNLPPQCDMNHVVTIQETGQVLFNLTLRIAVEPNQPPFLDIIGPLGLFIPSGLQLSVSEAEVANLPIQRCDANGCYVGAVLTNEQLSLLEGGSALTLTFSPQSGQTAQVDVPLAGFTAAFEAIQH